MAGYSAFLSPYLDMEFSCPLVWASCVAIIAGSMFLMLLLHCSWAFGQTVCLHLWDFGEV